MLKRLLFTLAVLTIIAGIPWVDALALALGKPVTFLVLATCALTLWVSGVALVLERN